MKKLLWGLILVVLASTGYAQDRVFDSVFSHVINWSGHYIKWVEYTPVIADTFTYVDTASTDAGTHVAITWTSHPQTMKITPTAANNYVYCDTLVSEANKYPMTWTAPATGTTVAMVVDSFVAKWNAATTIKDSTRAEDSATYIIIRDKRTGAARPAARWSTACPSRLADTTSAGRLTTVAMVCDSMVAKWNANSTMAAVSTAYDSTTLYHVRSDDSSEVYEVHDVANDSQAVAIISPANVEWTDTTWHHVMKGIGSYDKLWAGWELNLDYGGLTTDTMWVDFGRVVDTGKTPFSTLKATVARTDSLFGTSGWNLEKYLRAETAGDSVMRYDNLWLRIITRNHLKDSGASLDVYRDSSWTQTIHLLMRGLDGHKVR